jgi:hypothetical protein
MLYLKQSTAVTIKMGPFLDEDDGKTVESALTLSQADFRVSKNGGNFAQKNEASAATHDELGYYDVSIDTTDTNTLGRLLIAVHESGALPVWKEFMVVPANTYDSLVGGSDNLEVDAVAVSGDSTAADNLESDYDGTGYAKANSTIGTATNVTNQVSADMTAISGDSAAADNLETMLDGTGGQTLSLGQLKVLASGADHAVHLEGGPTNGHGLYCLGQSLGDGIYASGKHGLELLGTHATQGSGIYTQGNGSSGAGILAFSATGDDINGDINGSIGSLGTTAKSDVNSEVVDALATDTYAEPGSVPSATASLKDKIGWLFALARNKITQTSSTQNLRDDGDTGNIASATVSDDGTTATREEWV